MKTLEETIEFLQENIVDERAEIKRVLFIDKYELCLPNVLISSETAPPSVPVGLTETN